MEADKCLIHLLSLLAVAVFVVNIIGADQPQTAEIIRLTYGEPCRDADGNSVPDLTEWTTPDDCDRVICRNGFYYNFTLRYKCRPISDSEAPNDANCRQESNSSLAFPSCCPQIECDERAPTPPPPTVAECLDRASDFACWFWSTEGGCMENSSYFQFTLNYCNFTCGFCQ